MARLRNRGQTLNTEFSSVSYLGSDPIWWFTVVMLIAFLETGSAGEQTLHVVAVPVADLRAEPRGSSASTSHDPLQETQLVYGERVKVSKTEIGWTFVEAVEQPEYTHHQRW